MGESSIPFGVKSDNFHNVLFGSFLNSYKKKIYWAQEHLESTECLALENQLTYPKGQPAIGPHAYGCATDP